MGGRGRWWGKVNIQLQTAVQCHQYRLDIRSSLAPYKIIFMPFRSHTGHEMYLHGSIAWEKSCLLADLAIYSQMLSVSG